MKVTQLIKSDSGFYGGGGAVSTHRLHSSLRAAGVDSKLLCERKTTESPYVETLVRHPVVMLLERVLKQITSRLGLNDIHRFSSFQLNHHKSFAEADILHFHGTHGGFFNYLAFPAVTKNKPTVFTLCDTWAMTGHCAYNFDCDRWKIGCGQCPYPNTNPAIKRDATHLEWKLKDWVYSHSNLTIVSKSSWVTKMAQQSLLSHFPIVQIPNGIDTNVYQPIDPERCRSELGLPLRKKVLMFTALELEHYRKGGDLLSKALQALPRSLRNETVLLLMGKAGETFSEANDMQVFDLGYVSDDHQKARCYSAADLFLFPTRAETFGNVALESIACGTPVVSFRIGGVPDIVRSGITGYLAEPENSEDFCAGIAQLLEDDSLRNSMGKQCREIALKEYNSKLWAQRHIDLYQSLLRRSRRQEVHQSLALT